MPTYDVEVEITYRAIVQVDASSRREARAMAERGPTAWYGEPLHKDYCHCEAADAWRQTPEDHSEDEMTAWREREEMRLVK